MDQNVECVGERRIKNDSGILAHGALEMGLPLTELGRLWGRSWIGEEDRGLTSERAKLRNLLAIQMERLNRKLDV